MNRHLVPGQRPIERTVWALAGIAFVGVVIAVVALLIAVAAKHDASKQHDAKIGAVQALGTANASLTKNGLAPIATPTAAGPAPTVTTTIRETGPAGQQGATGPGPSAAQVQIALDLYCDQHGRCSSPPSAGQVAQALATYCDANGECRGSSGRNGVNATGAPGPSGAPGQNATADQVAAGVATYCTAHNDCAGPAGQNATGAPGADGKNGADGQPPVSWTYTTTDLLGNTTTHECTRTDPFDASAPTYTCN